MDTSAKASEKARLIARKNDLMRSTMLWCRVMMTRGVAALGENAQATLLSAVRHFNTFTEANDPHGEHDFGKIQLDGVDYFWKFDYYDADYEYFQEDGNRVLTIMRADEY